jgi:hypothetical protein
MLFTFLTVTQIFLFLVTILQNQIQFLTKQISQSSKPAAFVRASVFTLRAV